MRRLFLAGFLGTAWACGPPAEAPVFAHFAALEEGLGAARTRVQAELDGALEATAPAEPLEPGHVAGLVHMLAYSTGRIAELPLEEITTLGDAAVPALAELATRSDHDSGERLAACALLARVATPLACEQLMVLVERAPENWLRSQAAWRLAETDADWLVPRMLLRLKYEKDPETVIWLANALSSLGNFEGLATLWRLEREAPTQELSVRARERLDAIAEGQGIESAQLHWQLWQVDDPEGRVFNSSPSSRLELELWKLIEQLSGAHFQLRGVDDARFQLSRMGAWITPALCASLHDVDVHVRVHSAQCLERMGPRASAAGPALIEALADPSLANQAAAALGRVGYPPAEPALSAALADKAAAHELRVAAAAALGRLGLAASAEVLTATLNRSAEPGDLRQVAATALVRLGLGDRGAACLLEALEDPAADRGAAEETLERWLNGREDQAAQDLFTSWLELAPPPGLIPSSAQDLSRRAARRSLLKAAWSGLGLK